MRCRWMVLAGLAVLAVITPAAGGKLIASTTVSYDSGTVVVDGNIEANDVTIVRQSGVDEVSSPDALAVDGGVCTQVDATTVDCPQGGGVEFKGKNGNDSFDASAMPVPTTLIGDNGRDTLRGGQKRDLIKGKDGADALFGNGGNDHLVGGPGHDACRGGPGKDKLDSCE